MVAKLLIKFRVANMHEMSMMAGVFDTIYTAVSGQRVNKVCKVKLLVGRFTNAEPDALTFAFQAFSKHTLADGAKLEIEEVPVTGLCQDCGLEFAVEDMVFRCPSCRSFSIHIVSGTELVLHSLEVEV